MRKCCKGVTFAYKNPVQCKCEQISDLLTIFQPIEDLVIQKILSKQFRWLFANHLLRIFLEFSHQWPQCYLALEYCKQIIHSLTLLLPWFLYAKVTTLQHFLMIFSARKSFYACSAYYQLVCSGWAFPGRKHGFHIYGLCTTVEEGSSAVFTFLYAVISHLARPLSSRSP